MTGPKTPRQPSPAGPGASRPPSTSRPPTSPRPRRRRRPQKPKRRLRRNRPPRPRRLRSRSRLQAGFTLGDRPDLGRGGRGARDRRRLGAGLAGRAGPGAGAAAQCGRHRRSHHAHRRARIEDEQACAPVADPAAAVAAWKQSKNPSQRCAANSLPRARRPTSSPPPSTTSNAQPRADGSVPAPVDLSPLNERLAQIERAAKAQETEIAAIKAAEAKPVDSQARG